MNASERLLLGLMIRLYPRGFRRRFGPELRTWYDDRVRTEREDGRRFPRVRSLLMFGRDTIARSVPLRVHEVRRAWAHRNTPLGRHNREEGGSMSSLLAHNLKIGVRGLARQPGFSALVIFMITLGIAGNAVIFSLVNGLVLKPLPYSDPDGLVYLNERAPNWNLEYVGIRYPDFHAWQERSESFEAMGVFDTGFANLTGEGDAQRIGVAYVTHGLFDTFGEAPALGRYFTSEEDRPGGDKVMVLQHGYWVREMGGDGAVLGRTLTLDGVGWTIIGVLPEQVSLDEQAAVWMPLQAPPDFRSGSYWLNGVGRLRKGVSIEEARAELEHIRAGLVEEGLANENVFPLILPLPERFVSEARSYAYVLWAAVLVLLLIACINVASLMLARTAARHREFGIRMALGSGRWKIAFQLVSESLILAVIGGLLGAAAGAGLLHIVVEALPTGLPPFISFDMDWRVLGSSAIACGGSALFFGLVPALQAAWQDPVRILNESSARGGGRGRHRMLNGLVVGEVALSLTLLIGAALLIRSYVAVRQVDPGFRPENVLTFRVSLPSASYEESEEQQQFFQSLVDRLRVLPGVAAASATTIAPMQGHTGSFFQAEGGAERGVDQQDPVVLYRIVSDTYAETIGLTVVAGRDLDAQDGESEASMAALVNETFARLHYPEGDAVGKRIRFRGDTNPWMTIVGVTRDTRHYGLDKEMRPSLFMPLRQNAASRMTLVLRTEAEPAALVSAARGVLREMDPDLPLYEVTTMTELVEGSLQDRRLTSRFFVVFGIAALLLALGGIYGVISYSVNQRRREIGVRMALGADSRAVLGQVLRRGILLTGGGIGIGLAGAWAVSRLLGGVLFGISASDPLTYGGVALLLAVTAAGAAMGPAIRASRIQPMQTLRIE